MIRALALALALMRVRVDRPVDQEGAGVIQDRDRLQVGGVGSKDHPPPLGDNMDMDMDRDRVRDRDSGMLPQ